MRLYLDFNVFDWIDRCGQARAVRSLLDKRRHRVMASGFDLIEAFDIADRNRRIARVQTLVTVASSYAKQETFVQGLEVRAEVLRCRRDWLDWRRTDRERVKIVARDQAVWHALWTDARRDPTERPAAYWTFARDLLRRKEKAEVIQAALKRKVDGVGGDWSQVTFLGNSGLALDQMTAGMSAPERFWRYSAYATWHTILADRPPGAHDRREWSHPPLTPGPIDEADYARFWLQDVDGDRVPIQRVIGLAEHFQLTRKVGRGNLLDLHHAVHLLDADFFVTADRRLADVLRAVAAYQPARAHVLLLDRPHDALGCLHDALDAMPRRTKAA